MSGNKAFGFLIFLFLKEEIFGWQVKVAEITLCPPVVYFFRTLFDDKSLAVKLGFVADGDNGNRQTIKGIIPPPNQPRLIWKVEPSD